MSDRQLRVNWEKSEKPCVEEKAKALAKKILREHQPMGIPEKTNEQLRQMFPEIRP